MTVLLTEDSAVAKVAGPKAAVLLEKNKGIRTVGDLFEYLPRSYVATNTLTDMSTLREGQTVLVVAQVAKAVTKPLRRSPRQKMLVATLTDGQNQIDLTFFKAWGHQAKLVPGVVGIFVGAVSRFNGRWQLTHPEYEILGSDLDGWDVGPEGRLDTVSRLDHYREHRIPVYSETGNVSSLKIRTMVELAFDSVETVREPLPDDVRERRGLLGRRAALELVHRPRLEDDTEVGVERLRYDEAFVLQAILAQRRKSIEAMEATARMPRAGGLLASFDARLPFELTAGQRAIGETLTEELARSRPMHRLLQGEVGSGKTVVALRAMLAVIDAGGQAALLAPTEVLAMQHQRSISAMLGDLAMGGQLGGADIGTRVVLLTGSQPTAVRRSALNDAVTGDAGIVVGTHALIQEHVAFHDLALVVVDEQHRFGVEQRDALREKGRTPPHLLVMTATPIPRTVAMTVFGDMETSTLRELPAGRSPIQTHVVETSKPAWVERTWQRIAEEVGKGHQAYVVCPKIGDPADPSAADDVEVEPPPDDDGASGAAGEVASRELTGVYDMAERLRAVPSLTGLRIEVLHGRLDPDVKDRTMRAFAAGEIDVLVSTTVIEVGVDVANASVMVVMDADRFGISQLHQLRGRVGRGGVPGLCLLLTEAPEGTPARERLDAVAGTTDGFELARRDLELRREGDVLGARQSGRASSVRFLRMGNPHDAQIIADAREDATAVVDLDPTLAGHPDLAARVAARLDEEQAAYLERG
ncbi:MAG TPA: ATP-dependent DNA helicase RecG [Lapillicoccus sp.]|uniref:ATP-dependent DNA helicase RecG n=1 Tax=Lapillicoccus sp. TaxID=1909287 RepID=UPI002F924BED